MYVSPQTQKQSVKCKMGNQRLESSFNKIQPYSSIRLILEAKIWFASLIQAEKHVGEEVFQAPCFQL